MSFTIDVFVFTEKKLVNETLMQKNQLESFSEMLLINAVNQR